MSGMVFEDVVGGHLLRTDTNLLHAHVENSWWCGFELCLVSISKIVYLAERKQH